jgi:hypothetical protein
MTDHYGPRVRFVNCSSRFLVRRGDGSVVLRADMFFNSDGMHSTNEMVRITVFANGGK